MEVGLLGLKALMINAATILILVLTLTNGLNLNSEHVATHIHNMGDQTVLDSQKTL